MSFFLAITLFLIILTAVLVTIAMAVINERLPRPPRTPNPMRVRQGESSSYFE